MHPSPAVTVRADTPIAECIALMNTRKVGSVLVTDDSGMDNIIGIFTERDLLYQSELLRAGSFWTKPVRTVMSHPVISIDAGEVDEAGKIMLDHGFRHLPVFVDRRLAGVISIRDLLRAYVQGELPRKKESSFKFSLKPKRAPRILHVMAPHGTLLGLLNQLAHRLGNLEVRQVEDEGLSEFGQGEYYALDLDHISKTDWGRICGVLQKAQHVKRVFLFLNPALYLPEQTTALHPFESDPRFAFFAKPVNLVELMRKLETLTR